MGAGKEIFLPAPMFLGSPSHIVRQQNEEFDLYTED